MSQFFFPLFALSTSFFLTAPSHAERFSLHSTSFADRHDIPAMYTCDSRDMSPALRWEKVPARTQSLALIAEDPDAPTGVWYHWVIYNIPAQRREIPQGVHSLEAKLGRNSWGRIQYNGPCPPKGVIHRYIFTLYALDSFLNLPPGVTAQQLQGAMQGHILGKASIMGVFGH